MATKRVNRKAILTGIPIAVLALVAAGCGGSSSGGGDTVEPQSSGGGSAASIAVSDGHLVDGSGRTLYLFEADTSSTSTCAGPCAAQWPPATTTGDPTAGSGAKAKLLSTTQRSDGSTQVTYAGHPLYLYTGDTKAGDTNGAGSEAFGAEWYPVTPAGKTLEDETGGSSDDTSSTPSSGYTYSY